MSDLDDDVPAELARILSIAPVDERPGPERLSSWLCSLVRNRDYGSLADLRRISASIGSRQVGRRPVTRAALVAAVFTPDESQRATYQQVAFLFARYHMGATNPRPGFGNMGDAVRRIGTAAERGSNNPGAVRLLDRLTTSREVPWRFLQHAIDRARTGETAPPSWVQLTVDLTDWFSRTRDVPEAWARAFFTPTFPTKKADAA